MHLMQSFRRASHAEPHTVHARSISEFTLPAEAAIHLRQVESRLRATATICENHLIDLSLHLIEAGGKRLRPMLAVASAIAIGGNEVVTDRVLDAGVVVELLHLATLYHDDVLDAAALRRGRPSANARWGNHAAILGGDVLLAHAFRVGARLGPGELQRLCQTLTDICSGQIAESDRQFDPARDIAHYHASIRGKTAALLTTSCWLGASTAGASRSAVETLAQYGAHLGVAFQVIDDVLDLFGHSHAIGKAAGSDLRQGVFTLPVLLTLRQDPTMVELLVAGIDDKGIQEVGRRVGAVGADRDAVTVALDHVHAAFGLLADGGFTSEGRHLLVLTAQAMLAPLSRLGYDLGTSPNASEPSIGALLPILPGAGNDTVQAERSAEARSRLAAPAMASGHTA